MDYLRPIALAREHGISTQAVRNYEREGCIPPADRTASGYRTYTELHAVALRAYLALVPAHGYAPSRQIMRALNAGKLDAVLSAIDHGHAQLLRDRGTLDTVEKALENLATTAIVTDKYPSTRAKALTIGELARRLDVTVATLRNWEQAGVLTPVRESGSQHRAYGANDVRDAELTRMLRRGGYRLDRIHTIVEQVRKAGSTPELSAALHDWRQGLTIRGVAMLKAAVHIARYIELLGLTPAVPPSLPGA